ncbi:MAG: DNA polymerase III subunit delta [Cellulomonadaceae bacterium]|jgi:DNA polymerase-3 subunit delta|nr:DNA polymerase III subunit delta [Cellulomonadaceae bacterium]
MPSASRSTAKTAVSKTAVKTRAWFEPTLAPVVLVRGPEQVLRDRAVAGIISLARQNDPQVERVTLDATAYAAGQLRVAVSPSLFDEAKVVVVTGAEACTDDLITDVLDLVANPDPDTAVVVVHGGGVRGKKMLDGIAASGAPVIQCDELKKDADKAEFIIGDFRTAGRKAAPEAVRALVEALGSDLSELAAAASQLVADTTGLISKDMVDRYYGGRVEAGGFAVADAALAGDAGKAVALLRHALATGTDAVPIVAACAMKLRQLAKVAAVRAGVASARDVGLQDWQVRNVQRDLARWTPDGLAQAIEAVAQADADVKGGGRDPVYAVEKAVLTIAQQASR